MNTEKFQDEFSKRAVHDLPPISPLTQEQTEYLRKVVSAMERVIGGATELRDESIFGVGEFFWPKDPKKPVRIKEFFKSDNFKLTGIEVGFSRTTENSKWTSSSLAFEPRNFPKGAYSITQPNEFFENFTLLNSFAEERPMEAVKHVNVFVYSSKDRAKKLTLRIETKADTTKLSDKFPSSFHFLKLIRSE